MPLRKTRPLTARQQAALNAIRAYAREHDRMPTRRELGALLKVGCCAAHRLVTVLEKKGKLRRTGAYKDRGLQLLDGTGPDAIRQALERVASHACRLRLHATHEYSPLHGALQQLRETGWEPPGGWPDMGFPRYYVKGDLL